MIHRGDRHLHAASGAALLDRAVLETIAVRETLFAVGDGALVELADALLITIGHIAAGRRGAAAVKARLPAAA